MKNLVVLHLESVNRLLYDMSPELFPNIRKFSRECMRYWNYYSTATSTAMVLNDILYGDLYRIENTQYFGQFIQTHRNSESFVDVLAEEGYQTLGVHYPAALANEINPGHMYAKQHDLVNYSDYHRAIADVKETIDQAISESKNFSIYFCNELSHLCYSDEKKFRMRNPTKRWQYGYQKIDETAGEILSYLREKELLKDTVVILYGDHGDDFYGHDYNSGYAHSIEPYTNIIHTPLMIYDESLGEGEIRDMVCSLDIKQLVYNLVGLDRQENPFLYDRFRSKREYVFSRNLFAGQTPKKIDGFISGVRKAYSITVPEYTLLLTEEGWRMYLNQMDRTCSNNVLDFFRLTKKGLKHICELDFLYVHYKSYMGYGTTGEIRRNFSKMSKWMRKELEILEKEINIKELLAPDCEKRIFYTKHMA